MRIFLSCFLSVLIFFSGISESYAYSDVYPSTHLQDATDYLIGRGILNGQNWQFRPNDGLTRAELTKVSLLSAGIAVESATYAPFSDMTSYNAQTRWAVDVVSTAQKYNIIQGYPDGTFRPWQKVTWIEAMKIMLGSINGEIPTYEFDLYADARSSDWWTSYIAYSISRNLFVSPYSQYFGIHSTFPRKYMAQILYRELVLKQTGESVFPEVPLQFDTPDTSNATLAIPALGVEAPIIIDESTRALVDLQDWTAYEQKMQSNLAYGVVHYPYTAYPGQIGNSVITGHSSDYRFKPGNFKTIFAELPKLKIGDRASLTFSGKNLTYEVYDMFIVGPSAVEILDQNFGESILTLVTCYPVGTGKDRIIVRMRLIGM